MCPSGQYSQGALHRSGSKAVARPHVTAELFVLYSETEQWLPYNYGAKRFPLVAWKTMQKGAVLTLLETQLKTEEIFFLLRSKSKNR